MPYNIVYVTKKFFWGSFMQNITFLVLYNDSRQYAIFNHLLSSGYSVNLYDSNKSSNTIDSYISDSDVIILPTPVKEPIDSTITNSICQKHMIFGGKLPFSFVKECEAKGAFVYDLLKNPTLANINSIYTAEATIGYIINTTPFSLYGSKCLICGYGKCGRPISDLLRSLGATVDIYDICQEAIIYAHSLGYNYCTSIDNIPINNYNIIIQHHFHYMVQNV